MIARPESPRASAGLSRHLANQVLRNNSVHVSDVPEARNLPHEFDLAHPRNGTVACARLPGVWGRRTPLFLLLAGLIPGAACVHQRIDLDAASRLTLPGPASPGPETKRFIQEQGLDAPKARDAADKGLTLRDIRLLALENNPDVTRAQHRVQEAHAALHTASAWPNPALEGKLLLDPIGHPSGEAAFRFVLPLGGRLGAAERLALLKLDLARLELESARRQALRQVDALWARWIHAHNRLDLLRALKERSTRYAQLARSRRQANLTDPLDVALVLADAVADQRAVVRAKSGLDRLLGEIRRSAGLAPDAELATSAVLMRSRLLEGESQLIQAAGSGSLEVLHGRMRVLLADQQAERRATERLPDLHIGPAVAATGEDWAIGLSAGIQIPVFSTNAGPYQEALEKRGTALTDLRQAVRDSRLRVKQQLIDFHTAESELDGMLGEASQILEEAFRLAEVRFQAGNLDVLRLLSAHRAFAQLRLQMLDRLLQQRLSLIELQFLIGHSPATQEVGS